MAARALPIQIPTPRPVRPYGRVGQITPAGCDPALLQQRQVRGLVQGAVLVGVLAFLPLAYRFIAEPGRSR